MADSNPLGTAKNLFVIARWKDEADHNISESEKGKMATTKEKMKRKQVLMPSKMVERVQKIAKTRGVSFGEVIRNAVDVFDETTSPEDANLLDAMANTLINSTHETVARIDKLIQRMDETHAVIAETSHRDYQ